MVSVTTNSNGGRSLAWQTLVGSAVLAAGLSSAAHAATVPVQAAASTELGGVQVEARNVGQGDTGLAVLPTSLQDLPQVANVVTYIRNAWGNQAGRVSAGDVASIKKKL